MSQFTITITGPQVESEFLAFAPSHNQDIIIVQNSVEYNHAIYDKDGKFEWINLTTLGLQVPKEYMA